MTMPLIGITASQSNIHLNMSTAQNVTLVANAYVEIVNDYRCTPVILPSFLEADQVKAFVSMLDGVILTSGQDLAAESYNTESKVIYSPNVAGIGTPYMRPIMLTPDKKRDEVEIAVYQAAKNKGIPVLGICRGMQLINVAEGGSLVEELPESTVSHYIEKDGWINYHSINLVTGTLSQRLLGLQQYFVSSIHHQGIDRLATDLNASAYSDDGLIEILEHKDEGKFIIGVQSHIEKTRKNQNSFENIFQGFFERAKLIKLAIVRESK